MSYLTQLQQHNTDLQACIDKANALPDAGSGGGASVEPCTLSLECYDVRSDLTIRYIYSDTNGKCVQHEVSYIDNNYSWETELIVNSGLFVVESNFENGAVNALETTGGVELLRVMYGGVFGLVFNITGDGSIRYT